MPATRTKADREQPAAERVRATAAKRARKVPAKAAPDAVKVPQSHGGALVRGGVPGNRGGWGSLPSQLRDLARLGAEKGLALAAKIAAGEPIPQTQLLAPTYGAKWHERWQSRLDAMPEGTAEERKAKAAARDEYERLLLPVPRDVKARPVHAEIVRAADVLMKHGLGPQLSVDDARAKVAATVDLLRAELAPEVFARVAPQLAEVWA